jgi:hypothetical protein
VRAPLEVGTIEREFIRGGRNPVSGISFPVTLEPRQAILDPRSDRVSDHLDTNAAQPHTFTENLSKLSGSNNSDYRSVRSDDGIVRGRLRELAIIRRRFGYRRLLLLIRGEGISINHKRLRRLS